MVVVAKMDINPFCFADSCRLKNTRGSEYDNAGVAEQYPKPLHEYTMEEWDRILAVDLQGVFYCYREALKVMGEQKRGYADPEFVKTITAFSPLGRVAYPDEIKGMAIFLAAEASVFMCGQMIVSDGGISAK
jgi:NAD(P)-dependent dehydrogenase (short-subunit alcohol dehydrogenase family)